MVAGGGFSATWHALSVAMYDTASGQRLWNFVDTTKYGGRDVAFAPDGASVYVGNTDFAAKRDMRWRSTSSTRSGNRIFSRSYPQGIALSRLAVDGAGNVVATGTATPLPGSAYRDWMTIKTDAGGALLWARRYDASHTNDEVPDWVTVDSANAVYVAGMGGPSPNVGNVSFLKPVTLKYDSAGTPDLGDFQRRGHPGHGRRPGRGSVFTLASGQMTSARFEQTGISDPVPATPTQLTATGDFNGVEFRMASPGRTTRATSSGTPSSAARARAAPTSWRSGARRARTPAASGTRPLTSGATYTYRVRAVGFTGNSGYSNTATGTTSGIAAPAAPSNLVAAVSGSSVQLTWTDNSIDEDQFAIERCAGAACSVFTQIGAGSREHHQLFRQRRRRRAELLVSCPGGEVRRGFGLLQRGDGDDIAGGAGRADEPGRELERPPQDRPHVGQHRH